jgi:hypothetical protein
MYQLLRVVRKVSKPDATARSPLPGGSPAVSARPAALGHDLRRLAEPGEGVVQRQILGETGTVKNIDLAANQAAYHGVNGFTPPSVNGRLYQSGENDGWAAVALKKPDVAVRADGETFKARVTSVPTNHVGYRMYLPMAPPWTTRVQLDQMRRSYFNLNDVEAESANLTVTGPKGPDALVTQVTEHETVHANDILKRRDTMLTPWDKQVTAAMKTGTEFAGASEDLARAKLWQAVGGTPDEVALGMETAWGKDSEAFHAAPNGKTRSDSQYIAKTNTILALVWLTV